MEISEKMIKEFKEIYRKKEGKELSDEDARESAYGLLRYAEIVYKSAMEQAQKKHRLKKEPEGFPVDGDYSCLICHNSINQTNGWYDQWGQKCLLCQKAIKEGIIPSFICENRDSYFSTWQLKDKFGIKTPTAKKLIREEKLVARMVMNENDGVHEYIFLKKENPALIERYNPIRKSYDRNRNKVTKMMIRKERDK